MNEKKKITAAISAVMSYLQEEEAATAAMQAAAPPVEPAGITPPAVSVSLWGLSGRQAQMQLRTMMQLKAFKK